MTRFQNKVCLVTGGGSGIGKATCLRLAREGGKVVVVDVSKSGAETARTIEEAGGTALFVQADIAQSVQVQAAVNTALDRWGRIDILVNNAAAMSFDSILDLSEDEWDHVMNVNLRSVFLFCKHAVPCMPTGGVVVNISSVHAHATTKNVVPYAASKGAIESFTRGFSREMIARKIRVVAVAPGSVDTPMLRENPNVINGTEKLTGAIGQPEDVAAAICFMASEEARFITGTTLVADGGLLDNL